jgi:hypothetical protein
MELNIVYHNNKVYGCFNDIDIMNKYLSTINNISIEKWLINSNLKLSQNSINNNFETKNIELELETNNLKNKVEELKNRILELEESNEEHYDNFRSYKEDNGDLEGDKGILKENNDNLKKKMII